MTAFRLEHIGTLDLADLKDYYDAKIVLGGVPIKLDLNLETTTLPLAKARAAAAFVGSLAAHAVAAKAFIEKELGNTKDTTVKDFLDVHLEELPAPLLAKLLDAKSKLAKDRQLLGKLILGRVGLYPEASGDGFAIFDFTFEDKRVAKARRVITDQIIAVYLTAKGKVGHLSHES